MLATTLYSVLALASMTALAIPHPNDGKSWDGKDYSVDHKYDGKSTQPLLLAVFVS